MSLITEAQLKKICIGKPKASQVANMRSFLVAVNDYGASFEMDKLYNLTSFIGQTMVESGEFTYDREIWGPTAAQKKYEGRKDLGNVQKGDGSKFRGYGSIQLTGRHNVTAYYKWCLDNHTALNFPAPPDFTKDPSKIATDPWEGMSALWYWGYGNPSGESLNKFAADNNQLMVTRYINGGTTHYDRRLEYQGRAALVMLGYGVSKAEIKRFQSEHGLVADGLVGDRTRDALHIAMKGAVPAALVRVETVKETVNVPTPVPVKVESLEKPWYKDLDGVTQAGGGVLVTSAVGFLTDADTMKILTIAGIMAVGFGIWYMIRRSKAKAQAKEVQRIQQVAPEAATLAKVVGA